MNSPEVINIRESQPRESTNCINVAIAFQQMLEDGMTTEQIAVKVGYTVGSVRAHIDLLTLPQHIINMLHTGQLSPTAGKHLVRLMEERGCGALTPEAIEQVMYDIGKAIHDGVGSRGVTGPTGPDGSPEPPLPPGVTHRNTPVHTPVKPGSRKGRKFARRVEHNFHHYLGHIPLDVRLRQEAVATVMQSLEYYDANKARDAGLDLNAALEAVAANFERRHASETGTNLSPLVMARSWGRGLAANTAPRHTANGYGHTP